ncbi:VWA domain-containing protein [Sphingorhabdus arenilitoris]|uniref:VWA domain-containing protein n=1 Tax=Sphingorhabdus arenilitoris TaxID=1490041 RepID=A0ABV8RGB4_9SPHN
MRKFAFHIMGAASLGLCLAALVPASPAVAQDSQEDEAAENNIIVTGTRVRQGGAQDIKHFRSLALSAQTLPRPESLTLEGLLGEHDLDLPADRQCAQLFCLSGHAMTANLPTRPDDKLFVGLGFATNIDADSWRREPISLMAVVDRSGSMSGQPIETVKAALKQIVEELGDDDRMGIAIYGTQSLVHQQPIAVKGNKAQLLAAIDAIDINGSTNMEAGLKIGYDAAFREAAQFAGKTRMMLFTDEQPNTGNTDSGSFMGLARDASLRGIGLTTIGVGVQYDGALATKISSVRGGNVFFLTGQDDARQVITKEFRNMVSEVAHDIIITMTPRGGYSVSGVFGVPDGLMQSGKDGSVSITVPTAFLSSNGGGIFASLGKNDKSKYLPSARIDDGLPLMTVALSYVSAVDGKQGNDEIAITAPDAKPAEKLRLAHMLVDQYFVFDGATRAYHQNGDAKTAYRLLDGLKGRVNSSDLSGLDDEKKLIETMHGKAALFAGYAGEQPKELRPLAVIGKWQVVSHNGVKDLRRGDVVEFTDDEEFVTYFKTPYRGENEMWQSFQINEKQISVPDGDLLVDYRVTGNVLRMESPDGFVKIILRRAGDADTEI